MTERAQALPLPRVKKRHPRPPLWWWRVATCVFFAVLAVVWIAAGWAVAGAGYALWCAMDWRQLTRWPEDSAQPLPMDATAWTLLIGGLALIIASWFV
jgi:hypothetical protein